MGRTRIVNFVLVSPSSLGKHASVVTPWHCPVLLCARLANGFTPSTTSNTIICVLSVRVIHASDRSCDRSSVRVPPPHPTLPSFGYSRFACFPRLSLISLLCVASLAYLLPRLAALPFFSASRPASLFRSLHARHRSSLTFTHFFHFFFIFSLLPFPSHPSPVIALHRRSFDRSFVHSVARPSVRPTVRPSYRVAVSPTFCIGIEKAATEHHTTMKNFDYVKYTPQVCPDIDTLPQKTTEGLHRQLVMKFGSIPRKVCNPALDDIIQTRIFARVGSLQLLPAQDESNSQKKDEVVTEMKTLFSKISKAQVARVSDDQVTDVTRFVDKSNMHKHGFLNSVCSWTMEMAHRVEKNKTRLTTAVTNDELEMIQRSKLGVTICNRLHF